MKIEFTANSKPGAKVHVEALHAALATVIGGGYVDHLTVDGVDMIGQRVEDATGVTELHPIDPTQDKHTPHPPGHAHPAGHYSYKLAPKP